MRQTSQLCERARAWTSLRVDDELSELESALLDAHVGRCASCRAFAADVEAVSRALRAARLARPAPLAVPHAPRRARRLLSVAAASAAVLAAGAVAAFTGGGSNPEAVKPVAMVSAVESPDGLRVLRRPGLVERPRAAWVRLRRLEAEPV
jgi:predicted anti-sigma-YlaC factor YlaD